MSTEGAQPRRVLRPDAAALGIPRRAQIARNQQRNRAPRPTEQQLIEEESDSGNNDDDNAQLNQSDEKIGAKKRAKLEAKAEKKNRREVELKAREDRKKRDADLDADRKKEEAREEELERKREASELRAKEEKERRENLEYQKIKASFQVEEEGFDECDEDEKENLLQSFITYIQANKVVLLEDLATHFKLKTQAAIDRITDLQENGTITGVIDDQGKFIFISDDELRSIAKFIKNSGRISITELAESSNNLVNLTPITKAVSISS